MNRLALLSMLVMSFAAASVTYTVDTDRSGFSSVTLSMEGQETASVSIPEDASNFRIVGGSYRTENNTAIILSGKSGITTFSYSTSLLTTKTPGGWKLTFSPPADSAVIIYMPPYATIANSFPDPKTVSSEDSRTLIRYDYSPLITVFYSLGEAPQQAQSDMTGIYILAAALILASAAIGVSMMSRGKPQKIVLETKNGEAIISAPVPQEKSPSLEVTSGKKEMMETFNENDLRIVNHLLQTQGKSRRNELERKTGISKSSLAMAINRLEKRKIIEIDRTATTHFVKLSDYFLKL